MQQTTSAIARQLQSDLARLRAYLGDLADSPDLQARAAAVWPKIETQDFSV